jgi:prolyl-tRNA synthetase
MEGPGGFAYAGYCGDDACERAIQERTKATTRVLPDAEFRSATAPGSCVWCGRAATAEAVWARAY